MAVFHFSSSFWRIFCGAILGICGPAWNAPNKVHQCKVGHNVRMGRLSVVVAVISDKRSGGFQDRVPLQVAAPDGVS
jgi:hypothetical protein